MNVESMRTESYRSFKVADRMPAAAARRYRTLRAYDRLRAADCNEAAALEPLGIARRTQYRLPWKPPGHSVPKVTSQLRAPRIISQAPRPATSHRTISDSLSASIPGTPASLQKPRPRPPAAAIRNDSVDIAPPPVLA